MKQIKERGHREAPPAIATDGQGAYREALVETWGEVPEPKPSGKAFPPGQKQPQPGWHYPQVVKRREGGRVVGVNIDVIYGDKTTSGLVGAHTSSVERTNLTARQMNGRLVRKTLFTSGVSKNCCGLWSPQSNQLKMGRLPVFQQGEETMQLEKVQYTAKARAAGG